MTYPITNQRDLRRAFWETIKPYCERLSPTDVRCAFVDYIDHMARDNQISQELAQRATLD